MIKNLRQIILLAALAMSVWQQAFARSAEARYVNQNYGYAVDIPAGLEVSTDRPPAPQHGFQIILGQGRVISVDASFDSTFLGSAESAFQDRAADDRIFPKIEPTKHPLAGLDTQRVETLVNAKKIELAVAYRPNGNDVAIIYTFELDTDAAHQTRGEPVFNDILKGFSLINLPK